MKGEKWSDSGLKVVVTGANGFIGIHTIRGLLKRGYNVEAVDIKTEGLKEFSNNRRCEIHTMWIFSMMISRI
jgi:nucleoside-diphosphate-sugar epimerase